MNPIRPLVDAYDKAQSDTGNDMEYFTDAYLWIKGRKRDRGGRTDRGRQRRGRRKGRSGTSGKISF